MFYPSERINLHTHSNYCDHAKGGIEDYVASAMERGLDVLGFTEHAPIPGDPIGCNMKMVDLPAYVRDVNRAKETHPIHIFMAAECDYEPVLRRYYRDELKGKYGFDYLICSIHLYVDQDSRKMAFVSQSKDFTRYLRDYVARYCSALESKIFLFGCHPDLFRASYLPWNENARAAAKDIIQCAASLDIPLEINEAGLKKPQVNAPEGQRCPYSTDEFFTMAKEEGVRIILSSDAHDPALVADNSRGRAMAKRLGIDPLGCTITEERKLIL